jgi:hypothetical protein
VPLCLGSSSFQLIEFMNLLLLLSLQPFYRTLADSAKTYVQVERERDDMRASLERLSRKFFCHLILPFARVIALLILNFVHYAASGEKKELEVALAAQRSESKKELEAASHSAAARERGYANQLVALAQAIGGECVKLLFDT